MIPSAALKSDQFQTAAIVIAAMLAGGAATYFALRPGAGSGFSAVDSAQQKRDAVSKIQPPSAGGKFLAGSPVLSDASLNEAIQAAKAARAAGILKPVATTPEQFARGLGAINYRLHVFAERFPEPPAEGSDGRAGYWKELDQLTRDLANLLSDEAALAEVGDETPAKLAHHQAWLAAGSLDLDEATTVKVEEILAKGYASISPAADADPLTPAQEAELEAKLDEMTREAARQITALLNAAQKQRFDALGAEQVLFGLVNEGEQR